MNLFSRVQPVNKTLSVNENLQNTFEKRRVLSDQLIAIAIYIKLKFLCSTDKKYVGYFGYMVCAVVSATSRFAYMQFTYMYVLDRS